MVSSLCSTRRMARPIRDSLVGMYICYRVALTMGSRFCEGHQSLKKGFRKAPFQKVAWEPTKAISYKECHHRYTGQHAVAVAVQMIPSFEVAYTVEN